MAVRLHDEALCTESIAKANSREADIDFTTIGLQYALLITAIRMEGTSLIVVRGVFQRELGFCDIVCS